MLPPTATHRHLAPLVLLTLAACSGATAHADPPPPLPATASGSGPRERQAGISLALTVGEPDLDVGDELRFRLAFQSAAGQATIVVPPLDGSWDAARQPIYELIFSDEKGNPLPHALGYASNGRCGLTNPLEKSDLNVLGARGKLELKDAHAWAPAFRVLEHARPGPVWLRVRYRADTIPGATPLNIISNPVKLTISGGNEALWACREAQVKQAESHVYAQSSPSRIIAQGDGYLLVFQRTETFVRPSKTHTIGAIYAQRLGPRGQVLGDPVEVTRSDSDWLGQVETLEVPDGLLVAFTTARGEEDRDVRVAHVDTTQKELRPGPVTALSTEPGRPYFLALARVGDRAGVVWQGKASGSEVLRFRPLTLRGEPAGSAVSISASAGLASGRILMEPTGNEYLLAWRQGAELRFQRLGIDGAARSSAGAVKLADSATLEALGVLGDRVGVVYADSGVNHQVAGDSMGMHELDIAAADFRLLSDGPASPWDQRTARFGAAAWADGKLPRVWLETNTNSLFFASAKGGAAPTITLSRTAGGTQGLWATPEKSRVLAAWTDVRDDDARRCAPSDCVSEVYMAVLDPSGKLLVPPARATRSAVPRPVPLYKDNWRALCGSAPPATK